jgi:hypothetical protein
MADNFKTIQPKNTQILRARFEKVMSDNAKSQTSRTRPLTGIYTDAQMHGTGAKMRPASGIALPLSARVASGDYTNTMDAEPGYYDDGYDDHQNAEWEEENQNNEYEEEVVEDNKSVKSIRSEKSMKSMNSEKSNNSQKSNTSSVRTQKSMNISGNSQRVSGDSIMAETKSNKSMVNDELKSMKSATSNRSLSMQTLPTKNSNSGESNMRPSSIRSANSNITYNSGQSGRMSIYSKSTKAV